MHTKPPTSALPRFSPFPNPSLSLTPHPVGCWTHAVCIALLAPVLCMVTNHGRVGVHILPPMRSPVGCVCPQQSSRFKFARAWQLLPPIIDPAPTAHDTCVGPPPLLPACSLKGESIVLACLRQAVSSRWHRCGDQQHGWAASSGLFSGAPMQCLAATQPCAHVPSCASCPWTTAGAILSR